MKIDPFIPMTMQQFNEQRSDHLKKEQAANDFEEIFAKHLVKEMTKDSFKMTDNGGVMGNANNLYREHITEALAKELAGQRKLGMADLVSQYWSQSSASKRNV